MSKQGENSNPLSSAEAWNFIADDYVAELMDWAEFIAGRALELTLPSSAQFVDIAAGLGSLPF